MSLAGRAQSGGAGSGEPLSATVAIALLACANAGWDREPVICRPVALRPGRHRARRDPERRAHSRLFEAWTMGGAEEGAGEVE